MKNGEVKIFVIWTVVFSVATGIGVTIDAKGLCMVNAYDVT